MQAIVKAKALKSIGANGQRYAKSGVGACLYGSSCSGTMARIFALRKS